MSEPDIYTIKLTGYPEAQYVLWRDYEKLKAELDNLRKDAVIRQFQSPHELAQLRAEVERLRKAGDAMDYAISDIDPQRAERHRFMKLTDAEYIAVTKWRTAKDPNYNKA